MAMFITNDVGMYPAQGCTNPQYILRKKVPFSPFSVWAPELVDVQMDEQHWLPPGPRSEIRTTCPKTAKGVAMGLWGFTISSWNVTTVDGCEILHHQKDG